MLALWQDRPTLTVAEVLHNVEKPIATTSIASDGHWPVAAAENATGREPAISERLKPGSRRSSLGNILGLLDDAVLLLLVVLLLPLIILLIGTPVALLVRLLIEIAHQFVRRP